MLGAGAPFPRRRNHRRHLWRFSATAAVPRDPLLRSRDVVVLCASCAPIFSRRKHLTRRPQALKRQHEDEDDEDQARTLRRALRVILAYRSCFLHRLLPQIATAHVKNAARAVSRNRRPRRLPS